MYGMVNRAISEMVRATWGVEVWQSILDASEIDEVTFITNQSYADSITYSLVQQTAAAVGLSAFDILVRFGHWWIENTALRYYPALMAASGPTLPVFLQNLPDFHVRLSLIFPHLQAPVFHCLSSTPNSVHLRYESERLGLAPFVIGLLEGIGKMFATPVTVNHLVSKDSGASYDEFLVSW